MLKVPEGTVPHSTRNGVVRLAFYTYFALVAALTFYGLLAGAWGLNGGYVADSIPALGWIFFLGLLLGIVIAAQREFGKPVSYRKWITLCSITTLTAAPALVYAFFATFCVVCL